MKPGFRWNLGLIICLLLLVTNDTRSVSSVPEKRKKKWKFWSYKSFFQCCLFLFPKNKVKSHLQAPKNLPFLFLQPQASCSDSSAKASSLLPLWPACPCGPLCPACWLPHPPHSFPTPAKADSLGSSAWVNFLVLPVQPGDIPPRVTTVHFSEAHFADAGQTQNWISKDALSCKASLPLYVLITKGVVVIVQWGNPAGLL